MFVRCLRRSNWNFPGFGQGAGNVGEEVAAPRLRQREAARKGWTAGITLGTPAVIPNHVLDLDVQLRLLGNVTISPWVDTIRDVLTAANGLLRQQVGSSEFRGKDPRV